MTSTVLTPWWRPRRPRAGASGTAGSMSATRILDWRHARVQRLLADARDGAPDAGQRALLLSAHRLISERVRPVYAMNDAQPASRTLARRRGSCSQRLAVLEAVARAAGVPTRVRGLLVDGSFWYPRFPRVRRLVPDAVVLAWPEFRLDGGWVNVSELYAPLGVLGARNPAGFTNSGSQTLFEALSSTAVDWDGSASACGTDGCAAYDLSAMVRRDLGRFTSRDELFAAHGQTLCPPARVIGGALLSRVTPA
ncbi:transglutaminase domain-containing protein [Streptomyces sp. WAC05374]|uniref:transglutaminase domain-containing protein n=1 Tax=Streptomyces sp. WAC05374 TaxID=2487420 RepID=UPI000F86F7F0|nr:transglutaminase domain-containing protein [Streptomyces sp. WAC05374]RST16119.1 transglutaminase domain-containing protein [Streptomyces sp. WAC05374]TDF40206.1 transglutaminase domain-containing protein [Streptomyces sp. WAC05374]TDF53396.1 transglutaminase domain-containing protein [Streptomyces sp. WAC05374]TDF59243.1 transglutaminase domain-containing protein [Streptomyces sp. WAC05374]